jgi:hypothetical protein
MRLTLALIATLCASEASAGALVTAAAGGWDFRSDDLWSGVDISWVPTRTQGFEVFGRVTPAWGFFEQQPRLGADIGLVGVLPHPEATVRLGLVAEGLLTRLTHSVPLTLAQNGDVRTGVIPAGMGVVEFEYGDRMRYTLGARAGVGSEVSNALCGYLAFVDDECLTWSPGFAGGFVGRLRLENGFATELFVGPTSRLSVGYAW